MHREWDKCHRCLSLCECVSVNVTNTSILHATGHAAHRDCNCLKNIVIKTSHASLLQFGRINPFVVRPTNNLAKKIPFFCIDSLVFKTAEPKVIKLCPIHVYFFRFVTKKWV